MYCFFLGKFQYFGKCAGVKHMTNIMSAYSSASTTSSSSETLFHLTKAETNHCKVCKLDD